ncbi:MAG: hypothetical protein AABX54_05695 [Nanoarchaeota archaeon]
MISIEEEKKIIETEGIHIALLVKDIEAWQEVYDLSENEKDRDLPKRIISSLKNILKDFRAHKKEEK